MIEIRNKNNPKTEKNTEKLEATFKRKKTKKKSKYLQRR